MASSKKCSNCKRREGEITAIYTHFHLFVASVALSWDWRGRRDGAILRGAAMCVRTMARSSHQAPSVTPAERKNDTLHSALLSAWHFHCLLNKGWRGRKIEIACSEVSKRKYFQHWREDNNLFVRSMLVHRQSLQNKRAFTRQDEQRWEDKLEILFQTCYTVTFIYLFFCFGTIQNEAS